MAVLQIRNTYNTIDLQRVALWVGALTLVVDSICIIAIGEFRYLGFAIILLIVTMLVANEYYLRKSDAAPEA